MKILNYISVTNKEFKSDRKEIVARSLKRKQKAYVDKLETEVDDLSLKIDDLKIIKVEDINVDTWIQEYNEAVVNLTLLKKELKIAKNIYKDLFTSEKVESNDSIEK